MSTERIKHSEKSETWKIIQDGRTSYVKLSFDDDLDCVVAAHADHKSPWVSLNERYDSFEDARTSNGLPGNPPDRTGPAAAVTTPEAQRIARHHLGERLHWIGRGGPTADEWIVHAWPDTGHMIHAQAATVDAAAADCAAQLRAAGWVPSHARLEWTREFDDFSLVFHYDALPVKLWSGKVYSNGTGWAFNDSSASLYNGSPLPKAEIVRVIAEWCATNLPSLHLPPFPETPHD